jgi:Zn-dependent peptidase ImmA (M78 family)
MSSNSFARETNNSQESSLSPSLREASEFVIKRARELVSQLVMGRGQENPPFLAKDIAACIGIKDILCADLGELDGMLVRCAHSYIIKVNVNHHEVRRNFSCAHEIGHILLDELDQQFAGSDTDWRGGTRITGNEKERLCNIAAAELIMPAPVFGKYLTDFGLSIDSLERLASIFKVSIQAAAIRVQEMSPDRCRIILWKRCHRSRSRGFIQDHAKKTAWQTYVRDPSSLLKAYESNSTVKSSKCLKIDNSTKRCLMESKGFGRDKMRYVLSLILLDR